MIPPGCESGCAALHPPGSRAEAACRAEALGTGLAEHLHDPDAFAEALVAALTEMKRARVRSSSMLRVPQ